MSENNGGRRSLDVRKKRGEDCKGSKRQKVDRLGSGDGEDQEIIIESINASSATANRLALLESDAHIQFVQETCLTRSLQTAFDKEAKDYNKKALGSPLDPEHSKATAGVAVVAATGFTFYEVPNPTEDLIKMWKNGKMQHFLCRYSWPDP